MEPTRIELRRAVESDASHILNLIELLAIYEREPDAVEVSESDLKSHLSSGKFDVILAELKGEVIGMALYYWRYSTWKGPFIHLEDLIVKEEHRGKKAGGLLLEAVIYEAKKAGCKRLGWEVLDWNTPAVEFYEKIGATIEKEWWQCRMYKDDIQNYPFENLDLLKHLK